MAITSNDFTRVWDDQKTRHAEYDQDTVSGRDALFRIVLDDLRVNHGGQEALEQYFQERQAEPYFDSHATGEQRARALIERYHFENSEKNLQKEWKKILRQRKKQDETRQELIALLDSDNYQRWLEIRYQCRINEAQKRAEEDFMSAYAAANQRSQQPQQAPELFPRMNQVIDNGLYNPESYCRGFIGYTGGALVFGLGVCLGTMISSSHEFVRDRLQAMEERDLIYQMNPQQEKQALSYILLHIQSEYGQFLSTQETETLRRVIAKRAENFGYGGDNLEEHIGGIAEYEQKNPLYTDWVKKQLADKHLRATDQPLDKALCLYQSMYYTQLFEEIVKDRHWNSSNAFNEAHADYFVANAAACRDWRAAFDNNPVQCLYQYAQKAPLIFLDELTQVQEKSEDERFTTERFGSFETLRDQAGFVSLANHHEQLGVLAVGSEFVRHVIFTAAPKAAQHFISMEYRYLAGRQHGHQQGQADDDMSEEMKANLLASQMRQRQTNS